MPNKGDKLSNPITGDTYEFIETAKDTNGERVTMLATLKAKGKIVPNHFHVLQDESFEIVSGQMTIMLNGNISKVSSGENIILPKNQPHNHYNDGDEDLTYYHIVTPALDFDYLIENLIGLAADGKSKNGKYGLMQELVSLKYLESQTYLADIPLGLQKFLIDAVAPIGRLFGYRAIYTKYSGIEK
ncbi:MAG: cupin domain-containing protein [Ignavibacteria bacterium]|nr:cupin domain-containing protein [Ignavibacteria bacterium]